MWPRLRILRASFPARRGLAGGPAKQTGSAVTEFVVSLVVFVPLFLSIPLLGKYADIKHKNIEASRYVVWERTIWSDEGASWNDGEQSKSDAQIHQEMDRRLFSHPLQAMHHTDSSGNPLWANHKQESLLAAAGQDAEGRDQATSATLDEYNPTSRLSGLARGNAESVDFIAFNGLSRVPLLGKLTSLLQDSKATHAIDAGLGALGVECGIGVNLNSGLELGGENFAEASVTTPAINRIGGQETQLEFEASAAILSNAWSAPTEERFQERVDGLVPNQLVGCITAPGALTFGMVGTKGGPLFGEGRLSHPVGVAADTTVLPSAYVE